MTPLRLSMALNLIQLNLRLFKALLYITNHLQSWRNTHVLKGFVPSLAGDHKLDLLAHVVFDSSEESNRSDVSSVTLSTLMLHALQLICVVPVEGDDVALKLPLLVVRERAVKIEALSC